MAPDIRENANANLPTDLSQLPAGLLRKELELMAAELLQRGRHLGAGAGLLSGAGLLGVSAFNALTAALIAAVERRPARGAILVAAIYGVSAGGLADAGVKRLKQAPQPPGASERDNKTAAAGAAKTSRTAKNRAKSKASSSATAVKGGTSAKTARAGGSTAKAVKGKSPAKPVRSVRPRAART